MRKSKTKPKRHPQKPPIEERRHWRKIIPVRAREVQASDALILMQGSVKRFLTVCEIGKDKKGVEIIVKDSREKSGFRHLHYERGAKLKVRRTYHD